MNSHMSRLGLPALAVCALLGGGCRREEVQVYQVPKEAAKRDFAHAAPAGQMPPAHPPVGQPGLTWMRPEGWSERQGDAMRVGSFGVTNATGQRADVSVIPLAGQGGSELANVNRWRAQAGLDPIAASELPGQWQAVAIGTNAGKLIDITGASGSPAERVRILAALLAQDGLTWFFKMTGNDALVAEQKTNFVAFLKSVRFGEGGMATVPVTEGPLPAGHPPLPGTGLPSGHPPLDMPGTPSSQRDQPSAPAKAAATNLPAGWTEQAAKPMQNARYTIRDGSAEAEVSVSELGGQGGGALANVNRWRGQMGLGEVGQEAYAKLATALDVRGASATLVDVANEAQQKRLIAIILPHGDSTLFYKLIGEPALVGRQKDALVKFVQAAK